MARYIGAPLAGAWIETIIVAGGTHLNQVAPLAGAWIKTERHLLVDN